MHNVIDVMFSYNYNERNMFGVFIFVQSEYLMVLDV